MIASFSAPWINEVLLWGANTLLAATLVAAISLAASACAKRSPALRYGLLCSCLAALGAAPVLAMLGPAAGYSLWSWKDETWTLLLPTNDAETNAKDFELAEQPSAPPIELVADSVNAASITPVAPAAQDAAPTHPPAPRLPERKAPTFKAPSSRIPSPPNFSSALVVALRQAVPWLIVVWLAGAAVGYARLAVAWRRLHTLLRDARPAPNAATSLLTECRRELGVARAVALVASNRVAYPFAAGLRRACIVLPADWAMRASRDQLHAVLLHEAAHIVRRDPAIVLAQQLTGAFYWFHPLVRWFNQRLAEAREETCDNHVLSLVDAPAYSRTLLTLTELIQPLHPLPATARLFASRWRLEQRIAGLLDARRDRATRLTRRRKAIVGALAFVATVAASLAPGALQSAAPDARSFIFSPQGSSSAAQDLARRLTLAQRGVEQLREAGDAAKAEELAQQIAALAAARDPRGGRAGRVRRSPGSSQRRWRA